MKCRQRERFSETVSVVSASSDLSTIELYQYELPVAAADMERIERILRASDVFCPGPTAGDIYNWRTCRKAHADGVTIMALFDRNVLNDVAILAQTATSDFAG